VSGTPSPSPSILARILDSKRAELAAGLAAEPLASMRARAEAVTREAPARPFASALRRGPDDTAVRVIAEIKRASPSLGPIRPGADVVAIAKSYAAAGARALSVLTDGPFFGGNLGDLTAARAAVAIPVLRKDFLIDEWELWRARAAGADAVLLIVAALDDARLGDLLACARAAGLGVLVEAHDARELERALAAGADVVGVNHRDLATFVVDTSLTERLRPLVPARCVYVAESGIRTPADVALMGAHGADAVLVGEALMRAPDPGAALAELVA